MRTKRDIKRRILSIKESMLEMVKRLELSFGDFH